MIDDTGYLTVRLGTFRRSTSTSAEKSTRAVHIENCVIREGGEIQGCNCRGEQIGIEVYEKKPGEELWKDDPAKIGGLSTKFMTLYLPAETFGPLWAAAAATDGAAWRQMRCEYKSGGNAILSITTATLVEFLSGDAEVDFDPKTGLARPLCRHARIQSLPNSRQYETSWRASHG
jgi:hypothetical protein